MFICDWCASCITDVFSGLFCFVLFYKWYNKVDCCFILSIIVFHVIWHVHLCFVLYISMPLVFYRRTKYTLTVGVFELWFHCCKWPGQLDYLLWIAVSGWFFLNLYILLTFNHVWRRMDESVIFGRMNGSWFEHSMGSFAELPTLKCFFVSYYLNMF